MLHKLIHLFRTMPPTLFVIINENSLTLTLANAHNSTIATTTITAPYNQIYQGRIFSPSFIHEKILSYITEHKTPTPRIALILPSLLNLDTEHQNIRLFSTLLATAKTNLTITGVFDSLTTTGTDGNVVVKTSSHNYLSPLTRPWYQRIAWQTSGIGALLCILFMGIHHYNACFTHIIEQREHKYHDVQNSVDQGHTALTELRAEKKDCKQKIARYKKVKRMRLQTCSPLPILACIQNSIPDHIFLNKVHLSKPAKSYNRSHNALAITIEGYAHQASTASGWLATLANCSPADTLRLTSLSFAPSLQEEIFAYSFKIEGLVPKSALCQSNN